ncbi:MAG: hypothetical protein ACWGQW_26005, partial [bacterium]
LLDMIQIRLDSQTEPEARDEELRKLDLPGGFGPLFNYVLFLRNRVQHGDLLDLFFGYLLETEPLEFANQNIVQSNPRREEVITFYREFVRFKKWLYREVGSYKVYQPLTTKESDLEAANRILSYFGVKVREFKFSRPTYTPDPDSLPKLEVVVEPRYEKRRILLKWFGINTNLIGEGSILKLELEDATIPVLMGMSYWNRNFLKAETEDQLLLEWLNKPQVMKLYRALAKLPGPALLHFTSTLTADQLLEITPGLLSMGDLLDFDDEGRVLLPGGDDSVHLWSHLVRTPVDNEQQFLVNLFTLDEGRVLYYLASLSGQRSNVLEFLLSNPVHFEQFYGYLKPPP